MDKLVIALFFLSCYEKVYCTQCEKCIEEDCVSPVLDAHGVPCPETTLLDPCGCCPVCARMENQTCGGPDEMLGKCDMDLYCHWLDMDSQVGVCRKLLTNQQAQIIDLIPSSSNCSDVVCNVTLMNIDCPLDSTPVFPVADETCCRPAPYCRCDLSMCSPRPKCPDGQVVSLLTRSADKPGECCDTYTCTETEKTDCSHVVCEDEKSMTSCPPDSQALAVITDAERRCCHIAPLRCVCKAECDVVGCPPGLELKVTRPALGQPGACCHKYTCRNATKETPSWCHQGDREFAHGTTIAIDPCIKCFCDNGLSMCHTEKCPQINNCGWMGHSDNRCCPICLGCLTLSGALKMNGSTWQENGCELCRCHDGDIYCHAQHCAIACAHPVVVPGQCCPVCEDNEKPEDVKSVNDSSTPLPPIAIGGTKVTGLINDTVTSAGTKSLPALVTSPSYCSDMKNCTLDCTRGLHVDDDGCPECRCRPATDMVLCALSCPYGFVTDDDDNAICQCKEVPAQCPSMRSCAKQCVNGLVVGLDSCPKCRCLKCPPFVCKKVCRSYERNERNCKICKCQDDSEADNTSVPDDVSRLQVPGVDVTSSRLCLSGDGRYFTDGRMWFDGCRQCYCHKGVEMCGLMECPIIHCRHPLYRAGDCCPSCPGEKMQPVPISPAHCKPRTEHMDWTESHVWRLDSCTYCICHSGLVLCSSDTCRPVLCAKPRFERGKCCPICAEEDNSLPVGVNSASRDCTTPTGVTYQHAESWRSSPCHSCACYDGHIRCYSLTCNLLNCQKQVTRKGHCCATCLDDDMMANTTETTSSEKSESYSAASIPWVAILLTVIILQLLVLLSCALLVRRQYKRNRAYVRSIAKYQPSVNYDHNIHNGATTAQKTVIVDQKISIDPIMETLLNDPICQVCLEYGNCKCESETKCASETKCESDSNGLFTTPA